jgi:hypothetical protein
LHGYWDNEAVTTAMGLFQKDVRTGRGAGAGPINRADIARFLAAHEPANWKLPSSVAVEDWSVKWADEILPIARDAHERLEFSHIRIHDKTASGDAIERPQPAGSSYQDFAGKVVHDELHKAGWRLAALLEACLQ